MLIVVIAQTYHVL
jgi:DNA-binding transcriptional LysR family regulator